MIAPVMYSLLHATFRSGKRALSLRDEWLQLAAAPDRVQHIFAADCDDEISTAYPSIASGVIGDPMLGVSAVRNWNAAARAADGDILVVIADDLHPCQNWDVELDAVVRDLDPRRVPFVIKIRDTSDHPCKDHICHPIISRRYFERFGLWHPGYNGVFVDHDFTLSAHAHGIVLDGRNIWFTHEHPSEGAHPNESQERMRIEISQTNAKVLLNRRWPSWKRHIRRRYYDPPATKTMVSEFHRWTRSAMSKMGYAKALVPESLRRRIRESRS